MKQSDIIRTRWEKLRKTEIFWKWWWMCMKNNLWQVQEKASDQENKTTTWKIELGCYLLVYLKLLKYQSPTLKIGLGSFLLVYLKSNNGIEKEKDEYSSKYVEKVIKVCKNINVDITKNDIDRAHRVGKNHSTIIAKFFSFFKKTSESFRRGKKTY